MYSLEQHNQLVSPTHMVAVREIRLFALCCLQLVFGLMQVGVEEQDLSLRSSPGQGLFPTGQCPFSPISVCWVVQVQKHEYRKSIRAVLVQVLLPSGCTALEEAAGPLGQ